VRPAHFELVDPLLSLEVAPLLLDEELSLGVVLVLPVVDGDVSELVPPVLGAVVAPELMLPPLGGAPASLPDEDAPLPLAPDAPEALSPDELEPELPLLAPALAPPPAAPPAPCAHAAVAKATMAAVTAALMSFTFIFSSSRVGMEMDCGGGGRKNNALFWKGSRQLLRYSPAPKGGTMPSLGFAFIAFLFIHAMQAHAQERGGVPQFQVDASWPKPLPNRWILGQVSGIATDRYDRIWVVHRPGSLTPRERAAERTPPEAKCCIAAPPVLVFDPSGNFLFSWGGPGAGYQWPESEHGVYVDANDFVWLAGNGKTDGQLLKFTMDGKFVLQIGKQASGSDSNSTERLGSPADVAVDTAAREVFAADGYANRRVVVFDSETGAYKRHWGAYGKKPVDEKLPPYDPARPPSPQFGNPVHCIRLSNDGLVYVCDRTNDRVQVFRKDGSFVSEHVFEKETRGTGSVYDLVFSPEREQRFIYMIDGMNGEVRVVDRASKQVLGRFGRPGRQAGEFTALHNIAVDRQGNLYTAEVQTGQRVQKFRRLDRQE